MRILLIKPKARLRSIHGLQAFQLLEPLELGYLASAAGAQHDIRILDLRLTAWPQAVLFHTVRQFRPQLVGITGYSHEASIVKQIAAFIRRSLPFTCIVVGGHHATVAPRDYRIPAIDAIVRGEGCAPFQQIVNAIAAGRELNGIPQVLLTNETWCDDEEQHWPQFPDPANLPLPRRDLWQGHHYYSVWTGESLPRWQPLFHQVAMVRTSWGCRMHCRFCIVPHLCNGLHQPRPVASVVNELAGLTAKYIYFSDDENFICENFAWELAEAIAARGIKKRYFAWTRATTVNRSPELLRRWRAIGLDAAFLGFEFPTDDELKRAAKGGTVAANERALETLRSFGIAVHAAFMVQPEYGEIEFARLRDYVQQLPPVQCSFTVCTPSPGTPDYLAIEPRIWVTNPHDLHDCMHPLTPTAIPLRRFTQLFAAQAHDALMKVPMRVQRHPVSPLQLMRIATAGQRYYRGLNSIYQDYPRELWN
ncbi:B12-binding domain-containing radical SAM protein [Thiospirillum jenense]|uniref:Cobalamin B12-binding domain-containing protein n=1 Tax=Thiospirillum jenense TaxID=1653858 RepID=A0A839HD94_9GAMM|nr:cobalamin-dependent protein [Thiospirillum jenense]MBB1125157.1 cobalamin B12-binding domain-containing protein [Thiospirillum jenense]